MFRLFKSFIKHAGISLFALLIIVTFSYLYVSNAEAKISSAPDFTLKVLNPKASGYKLFSLKKFKGHIVIINFWATWCPPCRAEMPRLVRFYNAYKNKEVMVVGINVNNSLSGVRSFTKQYNISYPVVYASSNVISEYGGINEIPQTFFISKNGKIIYHWIGEIPHKVLYGITNNLLKP